MHDILNDAAGHILMVVVLSYAAEQALNEWRDYARRKLRERFFNSPLN